MVDSRLLTSIKLDEVAGGGTSKCWLGLDEWLTCNSVGDQVRLVSAGGIGATPWGDTTLLVPNNEGKEIVVSERPGVEAKEEG